jgi:hypothetical protein
MSDLTHAGQQCAIHMKLGFLPVVVVRKTVPSSLQGDWEWGRWRYARLGEVVALNSRLISTWRD